MKTIGNTLIYKLLFIVFFGNCHTYISAQGNNLFTLEDIETGLSSKFYPDYLSNLQWLPGATNYAYSNGDSLLIKNTDDGIVDIITLNELNEQLHLNHSDSINYIPSVKFYNDNTFSFFRSDTFYLYSDEKLTTYPLPLNSENVEFQIKTQSLAFTVGNNLGLVDSSGLVKWITNDTNKWVVNGQIVHRNEFGIDRGYFWSPDGLMLAYYKNDQRMVSKYPLIDFEQRTATVNEIVYPMAGEKSEHVSLWVYNLSADSSILIQTGGDPEQYLTNISWNNNSEQVYIQHLNRGQDTMKIVEYNAIDGSVRDTLYAEISKTYTEPQHPLVFSKQLQGSFYYQGRKDGYNHIYRYNAGTGNMVPITEGNWEVLNFYGFNQNEDVFYFQANIQDNKDKAIYSYNIETGKYKRLIEDYGLHNAIFSSNFEYFINVYSNPQTPRKVVLGNTKDGVQKDLLIAANPLKGYKISEPQHGTIRDASNAYDLNYRLVKPHNMDKRKKYPIVMYIYGGPHVQLIENAWGGRLYFLQQFLAQHGIASIAVDPRGSANRGMDFESIIHRQNGIPQLQDFQKALDFIETLGFIDNERIGVHGWSFGGFMTTQLMLKEPDRCKVGVAGGPVIDWALYEVMYGERYMDTPQENPEGYKITNLNNFADSLRGKLLIIHGAQDPVVVQQHSMQFMRVCIEKGRQIDYFLYPTHEHNVRGNDRVHLIDKITKYFIDNL